MSGRKMEPFFWNFFAGIGAFFHNKNNSQAGSKGGFEAAEGNSPLRGSFFLNFFISKAGRNIYTESRSLSRLCNSTSISKGMIFPPYFCFLCSKPDAEDSALKSPVFLKCSLLQKCKLSALIFFVKLQQVC